MKVVDEIRCTGEVVAMKSKGKVMLGWLSEHGHHFIAFGQGGTIEEAEADLKRNRKNDEPPLCVHFLTKRW